jgi:hypothetical protein
VINAILGERIPKQKGVMIMKYMKSQMQQLIKDHKELHTRLKELKVEHGLEKNNALKALYHSEVADGGKYQLAYQALDQPKK